MANLKTSFFPLELKDVVLVKPSKPTPSDVLSLSSIENNPYLNIMCHIIYVYRAKSDYPQIQQQQDPAYVIKEALSKALVHYYPLAVNLKRDSDGKLRINCNADGVPFLEAKANCELSSIQYLDKVDVKTAKCFVFDFPTEDEYGQHPLVLKVTKFLCGRFTIGLSLSHSICDGFGAAQFIQALAEFASGKSEPSVKPMWEGKN